MKAHLSVFALSVILITSIGMTSAFGQIQDSIVVTTDKASYSEGEIILVTGEVRDLYSGTPVSVIVTAPNGNIVSIAQVTVGVDKKFSTEVTAGGALMKVEGSYTVA
ncbi:MAG: copper-binding protein, partial [Nitrosopumilus sp.]